MDLLKLKKIYYSNLIHFFSPILCSEILEEAVYFDENKHVPIVLDMTEDNWYMTCIFLTLFLISLLYGILVTHVKVREINYVNGLVYLQLLKLDSRRLVFFDL